MLDLLSSRRPERTGRRLRRRMSGEEKAKCVQPFPCRTVLCLNPCQAGPSSARRDVDALINDLLVNRNGDSTGVRTPSSPGTPAQGHTGILGPGSGRLSRASNASDQPSLTTNLIHPNGDHTHLQPERPVPL